MNKTQSNLLVVRNGSTRRGTTQACPVCGKFSKALYSKKYSDGSIDGILQNACSIKHARSLLARHEAHAH